VIVKDYITYWCIYYGKKTRLSLRVVTEAQSKLTIEMILPAPKGLAVFVTVMWC